MPTDTQPIPLPVTAVTCLEDRAHIERTAELDLRAGVQRLRLGPISALAVDRTLHAELTGEHSATVLDVRIVRTWTPRGPLPADDDSALRTRIRVLEEEQITVGHTRDRLRTRLDLLGRLATDLLRDIAEGTGYGETDEARWTRELDRVDAERDACGEQLRAAEARLTDVAGELLQAQQAIHLAEERPAELIGHVELTVRTEVAERVRLRLTHLTSCALWRPVYRAVLDGDSVTLETDAMVWQRTGEDWSDVRLTLSTARSALTTDPPRLTEDRLTLKDRSAAGAARSMWSYGRRRSRSWVRPRWSACPEWTTAARHVCCTRLVPFPSLRTAAATGCRSPPSPPWRAASTPPRPNCRHSSRRLCGSTTPRATRCWPGPWTWCGAAASPAVAR